MVAIEPFCALRYDASRVVDLSAVIAPPYDVIDAAEQSRLYERSPYNMVRLILGKALPTDTPADTWYLRARRDFDRWRAEGVLRQDEQPALYLIEHAFTVEGQPHARLGITAALRLEEGIERGVFRHEATLEGPKRDRTKLLEAIPANLSPIFCVYPDADGGVHRRLAEVVQRAAPAAQAALGDQGLRLWRVTDPVAVRAVAGHLASTAVLIADGHHRFEVAYAHRQRYGRLMTHFVSMADPSLLMRPIHRVVRLPKPADAAALQALGQTEPMGDLPALRRWLSASDGMDGRFGCYDGRRLLALRVTPSRLAAWCASGSVPERVARLCVSTLHGLVLPALGGADGTSVARYTADAQSAVRGVDGGEGQMAWLLPPLPIPLVYELAKDGLRLPAKSTFFYPKVLSGLTLHVFE